MNKQFNQETALNIMNGDTNNEFKLHIHSHDSKRKHKILNKLLRKGIVYISNRTEKHVFYKLK